MGCHFLLQCMKVKSESEVAQSCPTLRDPMDFSLPGSSTHGIFQARVLERAAIAFSDQELGLLNTLVSNFLLERQKIDIFLYQKLAENLVHNMRVTWWVSPDPKRDANKFTSEEYYTLFYFLKSPSVQSAPRENVTSYTKLNILSFSSASSFLPLQNYSYILKRPASYFRVLLITVTRVMNALSDSHVGKSPYRNFMSKFSMPRGRY